MVLGKIGVLVNFVIEELKFCELLKFGLKIDILMTIVNFTSEFECLSPEKAGNMSLMPCPFIGPKYFGLSKLFWTVTNYFGQVLFILVGSKSFWSGSN